MGHNRAGDRRKQRQKRRQRQEARLDSRWPDFVVHGTRLALAKDGHWIDFGLVNGVGEINQRRLYPKKYCTLRTWLGRPLTNPKAEARK